MSTVPPHGLTNPDTPVEVRGLRSAMPEGAGNVVTSMMRILSRVTEAPVLFVNLRLTMIVPNVELLAGSLVKSRMRFGESVVPVHGKTRLSGIVLFR